MPGRHRRPGRCGQEGRLQQDQRPARGNPRSHGRGTSEIQKIQPQMAYLNILREVLPANAIVTDELSQVGFASWYGFPIYEPRTFITSGFRGTLGSASDRARRQGGASDRPGGRDNRRWRLHFGVQELSTAVQFKIGVVTLVFKQQRLWQCPPRPARTI